MAHAQTTDQAAAADAAFQEGNRLMAEGKTEEACPKLAASHKLDPSYGAVYNLGSCYEALGKTASAWAAFREAAELAEKRRETARVDKARRRAAGLEAKLVRLRVVVTSPPQGLVIQRDGVMLDPALWDSEIPVDPGEHEVLASAPGKTPWTATVTLQEPGKTVLLRMPVLADSTPLGGGGRSGTSTQPHAPEISRSPGHEGMGAQRIVALGAAGIGVAGLAVGTVFGVQALSKWNQAKDGHCDATNACDDRGVALHGEATGMAHISTASFVVGGAAIVAAAALWLTAPVTREKEKGVAIAGEPIGRDKETRQLFGVTPLVGAGSGGVLVTGSF